MPILEVALGMVRWPHTHARTYICVLNINNVCELFNVDCSMKVPC